MTKENLTFQETLGTLSGDQLKFIAMRLICKSDAEAAEQAGISKKTVYSWPNKADVNEAVRLAKMDGVEVGREKLRRLVLSAVDTIAEILEDGTSAKRLDAAIEVLDRTGIGKITAVDVTTGGRPIGLAFNQVVAEMAEIEDRGNK